MIYVLTFDATDADEVRRLTAPFTTARAGIVREFQNDQVYEISAADRDLMVRLWRICRQYVRRACTHAF